MKRPWAFYLILVAFSSHNLVYLSKMLFGNQPIINDKCPFAISLLNTPLLFDRDKLFFNTQEFKLTYQDKVVSLTRRDIRKGLFSYFDMLYFSHWGTYSQIDGADEAILSGYFCHRNTFMTKMKLKPPTTIERQIFDSQNRPIFREMFECRK
jgi:hypothetical protein